MILCLDTSTPAAQIVLASLDDSTAVARHNPELNRLMARDILAEIEQLLKNNNTLWAEVEGIVVFKGPGSFTGLRIGITIANTIAYAQSIPVVGATGEQWISEGLGRLRAGHNDKNVVPHYGAEPHITQPRK